VQQRPSEALTQHRKASPLIIVQAQPTAAELRLEHGSPRGERPSRRAVQPRASQASTPRASAAESRAYSNAEQPGALFRHYALKIDQACYKLEPPPELTAVDVLVRGHALGVARGDHHIVDAHLADAIEALPAT
jgi:hypothetical protein